MMKKIFILMIPILFITGCVMAPIDANGENSTLYMQNSRFFSFYVDKDTCIEYIYDVNDGGVLIPRLNRDGLPLLNEKCLKGQQ